MRGRGRFLIVSSALIASWPHGDGSAAKAPNTEWRKALELYKRKQYELACPLFESAANAKPKNGAIWGDLGLCELKRGNVTASVHASRLAAHWGSESVRKAAYFNLGLASSFVDHSVPLGVACKELPSTPESACSKPAFACLGEWQFHGTGVGTDGTMAFFADTEKRAKQLAEEFGDLLGHTTEPPATSLGLTKHARCFSWCARHPEVGCVDECDEGELLACSLVYIDACKKHVGYVCTEWIEVNGRKRVHAGEFAFPEEEDAAP